MIEENSCINQLHEYQFKELLEAKDDHDKRIKLLEEHKTQITMEFANLKQNQAEQKALTLELDRSQNAKNEKLFDKVLTSQDIVLNKVLESISTKDINKTEITKGKIALYSTIIVTVFAFITVVVEKFIIK